MPEDLSLRSRVLLGALAGLAGTASMTAVTRRLHQRLPEGDRYPLPPRELIESLRGTDGSPQDDQRIRDLALAAHFGFGASAGALLSVLAPRMRPVTGAGAGVAVWLASYLGWIPALTTMQPANRHPMRRNALMAAAHLVWGTATAFILGELYRARATVMAPGPLRDLAGPEPPLEVNSSTASRRRGAPEQVRPTARGARPV